MDEENHLQAPALEGCFRPERDAYEKSRDARVTGAKYSLL